MNKDIRLNVTFLVHRKQRKLYAKLGSEGVLCLVFLLLSTAMNRPKGVLVGMTEEDIALDAQWPGDPKEFVKTLVDVGFIDHVDGVYSIHDWEEHNTFAAHADERSERAKKAAAARWEKKEKDAGSMQDACKVDATRMQDASLSNAPSPSPSPSPSPKPIPSLVGREKNRPPPKKKPFTPPTKTEVIAYFLENGFMEATATRAWEYYEAGNPSCHHK